MVKKCLTSGRSKSGVMNTTALFSNGLFLAARNKGRGGQPLVAGGQLKQQSGASLYSSMYRRVIISWAVIAPYLFAPHFVLSFDEFFFQVRFLFAPHFVLSFDEFFSG